MPVIKIKRGLAANVPALTLEAGNWHSQRIQVRFT